MTNDTLQHHGILGMKWGVRRTKAQLARLSGSSKDKSSEDGDNKTPKSSKSGFKNPRKMSDEELREVSKRLELEQSYLKLSNDVNAVTVSKGKKFLENVLTKSGENLAIQVLNHYGAKGLNKLIGSEVIFANNKKKS